MRAEHREQEERRQQELATRDRVLAAILEKVTAPLAKADLDLIAREFLNTCRMKTARFSPSGIRQRPRMANLRNNRSKSAARSRTSMNQATVAS